MLIHISKLASAQPQIVLPSMTDSHNFTARNNTFVVDYSDGDPTGYSFENPVFSEELEVGEELSIPSLTEGDVTSRNVSI